MHLLRVTTALALVAATAGAETLTVKGNSYTLPDHPRVFLDGPSGTITTRVKDPDGAGAGVAPQATDANPAFLALKDQVRSCRASPTYCSAANERAATVHALALDWYMDNSQTESLAAAIYWLNNVETWITSGYGFACDIRNQYCGLSSWADWPSYDMAIVAQAYSLVRSEMSAGERTAFAQKMFNDDTAGYEDGCDNQLQQEVGAVATFSTGGTVVTGSGLSGLTAGRQVYIKASGTGAGGWATISTVDSASQLTLTGAPQSALGGNATGVTSGQIHELKPWTSTTCGLSWMVSHHAYAPQGEPLSSVTLTTAVSAYAIDATTVNVVSTTGLPSAPFYVYVPGTGEVMRVTSVGASSLTVERAALGTTATAGQFPPRPIYYSRYVPAFGSAEHAHNLVVQKLVGYLAAGMALAEDSARAKEVATAAANHWLDNVYPANQDMWTGFQQGGSTNYGPGRQQTENVMIVTMLAGLTGSPSLDKTGGNWLANLPNAWLYTTLPTAPATFVPWGQPDIAATPDFHAQLWAPLMACFDATTDGAKHWNYWQRSVGSVYTRAGLTSGSVERMIPFALACFQESDTATDYRSVLGTEKAFASTDGTAGKGLNAWVSRSGWSSSSDSLLFAQGFSLWYGQDRIGTGAPAAYKLYKGGWTLGENGAKDTGAGADTNMVLFGGAANLKASTALSVSLDRSKSGTGWAYSRFDSSAAYSTATAVTRALRELVHFKASGQPDYLVVYDSAATSATKAIGQNLHYDKTSGEGSGIADTLPNIEWTGPARSVRTKVVLPSGTGVARTASSLTNSFREYLCASSDGSTCASVTSAEFLLVHKPAATAVDTMPTVNALATIDSDFSGVEIADAGAPSVAAFAKAGASQNAGSFTTTLAGTAQIVVTGLSAGTYDVTKGGSAYLSSQSVDTNGVLAFTGTAAAYAFSQTGTATAPTITTTTLANGVLGQAYSATLAASDGALPLSWDTSAGSLCSGLSLSSAGVISGTPTAVETCSFTARVTDNLAQTDTQALSITIQTPPPTLTVTAQPGSTSVVLGFGTPGMAYGQSCTAEVSQVSTTECQPGESVCSIPVGSATSSSGASTRRLAVTGLTASTSSTATVTCGTVAAGSVTFTTQAAASGSTSTTWRLKPPAWVIARATAVDGNTNNLGLVLYYRQGSGAYSNVCLPYTAHDGYADYCTGGVCALTRSLAFGVWNYYWQWSRILDFGPCAEATVLAKTAHRPAYLAIP